MPTHVKRESGKHSSRRHPGRRGERRPCEPFDYAALSEPVRRDVMERAAAIHERIAARPVMRTAQDVVEIGRRLHIVRDLIGRRFFQSFLNAEFQWSQQSASRFMRAAHVFRDVDCLENFQPGALYVLSMKDVPAAALADAVALAKSGDLIRQSTAFEIVLRCTGRSPELLALIVAREAFEKAVENTLPVLDSSSGPRIQNVIAGLSQWLNHFHSRLSLRERTPFRGANDDNQPRDGEAQTWEGEAPAEPPPPENPPISTRTK